MRLDRRQLLRTGAGMAAAWQVTGSQPAAGSPAPRFLLEWGKHGSGPGEFDAPIGIAIDAQDRISITDFKNKRVQRFDANGKLLSSFPVAVQPAGIAVDDQGQVYVSHWNLGKVVLYSATGETVREIGRPGTGSGELRLPGGLALDRKGGLYVADQGNGRVQQFGADGRFLRAWGAQGSGPGQFGAGKGPGSRFAGPQFVALDREGNVYATDQVSGRVQKFTAEGRFLAQWGGNHSGWGGFGGRDLIAGPIALCTDRQGCVWVGATNHRIQQFDPSGRFLAGIGGEGSGPGQFRTPHGLAVDSRGDLYVVDTMNARVQKFRPAG